MTEEQQTSTDDTTAGADELTTPEEHAEAYDDVEQHDDVTDDKPAE